jgi:hypothetical protein
VQRSPAKVFGSSIFTENPIRLDRFVKNPPIALARTLLFLIPLYGVPRRKNHPLIRNKKTQENPPIRKRILHGRRDTVPDLIRFRRIFLT